MTIDELIALLKSEKAKLDAPAEMPIRAGYSLAIGVIEGRKDELTAGLPTPAGNVGEYGTQQELGAASIQAGEIREHYPLDEELRESCDSIDASLNAVGSAVTALERERDEARKERSDWIRWVIELGQLFGYDGDQCADVAMDCIRDGAQDLKDVAKGRDEAVGLCGELLGERDTIDLALTDEGGVDYSCRCRFCHRRYVEELELCTNPECPAVRARAVATKEADDG